MKAIGDLPYPNRTAVGVTWLAGFDFEIKVYACIASPPDRAPPGGEMIIRRALPSVKRQMVGPFIFFDQMGPAEFLTDRGIDVRPHPHINLATVTYLFEGQIPHRDSFGREKTMEPGAVNWMRAGRGIIHSERTGEERRHSGQRLFGIQSWMALPEA